MGATNRLTRLMDRLRDDGILLGKPVDPIAQREDRWKARAAGVRPTSPSRESNQANLGARLRRESAAQGQLRQLGRCRKTDRSGRQGYGLIIDREMQGGGDHAGDSGRDPDNPATAVAIQTIEYEPVRSNR